MAAVGFYSSSYILGRWFTNLIHIEIISGRAIIFLLAITLICVTVATILYHASHQKQKTSR
jgi:multisubunit Na+/H+ antiporter MnhG subunit